MLPIRAINLLLKILYRFRVEGRENVPKDGPVIILYSEPSLLTTLLEASVQLGQTQLLDNVLQRALLQHPLQAADIRFRERGGCPAGHDPAQIGAKIEMMTAAAAKAVLLKPGAQGALA